MAASATPDRTSNRNENRRINRSYTALQSRTVIDMAIGAIMAENRCSRDKAFSILTKAFSTRNIKLREVAASVIASISGEKRI